MSNHHITKATSYFDPNGHALNDIVSGTLLIDAGAFLYSGSNGDAAHLQGEWDITINGTLGAFGASYRGLNLQANSAGETSTIAVGKTGEIFGEASAILLFETTAINNKGTISGDNYGLISNSSVSLTNKGLVRGIGSDAVYVGSGTEFSLVNGGTISGYSHALNVASHANVTNYGLMQGDVTFAGTSDTFVNFKLFGTVTKNGKVLGLIDLGDGTDHFTGGANAELVRDGSGGDSYNFNGGNDTFIAVKTDLGTDALDTVIGGKGIDTYDASDATSLVRINLSTTARFFSPANSATGTDVGFGTSDTVTAFENAIGGSGGDTLYGSTAANALDGGAGADNLYGLGGRDVLTGGAHVDNFYFEALSDSGVKASARDLITDFQVGVDKINLSAIDIGGNPAFTNFIDTDFFSKTPGELRMSYSGGNTIVSGDVNGDDKADFAIALQGHLVLHAADFTL